MPEIRKNLPCRECSSPQAADVMVGVGQGMFVGGANLSPSGLPLTCCRVRIVVDMQPSATSSAAPATGKFIGGRRSAGGWPFGKRPPLSR
jgi:hypothetical protein